MHIGGTFHQAESHELIRFRCTNLGTDEYMIELNAAHKLTLYPIARMAQPTTRPIPRARILQIGSSLTYSSFFAAVSGRSHKET